MADKSITPPPDKPEEDFEAVLPLPIEGYGDKTAKKKSPEVSGNPALDLIRKKNGQRIFVRA